VHLRVFASGAAPDAGSAGLGAVNQPPDNRH
jgi:hypothetical protein